MHNMLRELTKNRKRNLNSNPITVTNPNPYPNHILAAIMSTVNVITISPPHLRNDLYCVEWDVKL